MTNPLVAKATAEIYLTKLFDAFGLSNRYSEELGRHVLTNVREGHDGYPVIKVVGRNRLVVEFDLDVKPFSEAAIVNHEDHGEAGRELLADAHTPAQQWPAPTLADNPEGVDEDNLEDLPADIDGAPLPDATDDSWREANPDSPEPEAAPADGYRSPWMDEGDKAAGDAKGAVGN